MKMSGWVETVGAMVRGEVTALVDHTVDRVGEMMAVTRALAPRAEPWVEETHTLDGVTAGNTVVTLRGPCSWVAGLRPPGSTTVFGRFVEPRADEQCSKSTVYMGQERALQRARLALEEERIRAGQRLAAVVEDARG